MRVFRLSASKRGMERVVMACSARSGKSGVDAEIKVLIGGGAIWPACSIRCRARRSDATWIKRACGALRERAQSLPGNEGQSVEKMLRSGRGVA